MKVFLSVGRVGTREQREFLRGLEEKLRTFDLEPRTIGRNTFTAGQPLERVKEVMRECRGLLVLAFERTRVPNGTELQPDGQPPLEFGERQYATPWHQIELAMASMLGLPTLVILEKGIYEEGLLEDKYGWYVYRTKLKPSVLEARDFSGILNDWISRTQKSREADLPLDDITIGKLARNMKPAHLWALLSALVALSVGAFGLGRWEHSIVQTLQQAPTTEAATGTRSPGEHDPARAGDEQSIGRDIERLASQGQYDAITKLFPTLAASHVSGVGYSAYPEAALAYDQVGDTANAIRVVELLQQRLQDDASKGYGYLAPGRPPRARLKAALVALAPRVASSEVKARILALADMI